MIDNIFLPFPDSFKRFCTYSLDEAIPVWLNGCLSEKNNSLFSDLFENNITFVDLDKASITAINEFGLNIIDIKYLIQGLVLPDSEITLKTIINHEPTIKILHDNNFFKVKDIKEFGLENFFKVKNLGVKKFLYIVASISEFHENLSNDSNNDSIYSDEEALIIFESYLKELPLEKIYISDPRFRGIYVKYLPKLDEDFIDTPSWQEVFLLGDFDNNNSKIEAIKEIDACLNNLNNLTLEDQMSDFFIQFFKNSTNNQGFLDRKVRNFNVIKNRLGINKSMSKPFTLQKTADDAPVQITRERVRQIVREHSKVLDAIPNDEQIFIPKLYKLLDILNENINKSYDELSKILSESEYDHWSIERLFQCLDLFRIPNNLTINNDLITDKSMVKSANFTLKIAKKITNYNGALNSNHLHNVVNKSISIEKEQLISILSNAFEQIEGDWFFVTTNQNHLYLLAQRMSNFSMDFSSQSLREAHMKHKRCREVGLFNEKQRTFFYGYLTPPTSVIEKIMNLSPDFESKDGRVYCINLDNEYIKKESHADYQFLKYFQARNFECANLDEMKNFFLVDNGMPEGSFFQFLTYKPYIKRLAGQVYGIVGKDHDSISLEHAKNRIRKNNNPPKIEWIEGGLEIKYQLKHISNSTVGVGDYINYISDNEFIVFQDGEEYCKLKVSSNFLYGMGKYLKNVLICEMNDFILIQLDLENYNAQIELISEDEYEI